MKAKESIFIYRYRRSIHGKQWCPCFIVGNKFPVESHVLIYIEDNGEQRYRYRTVDTRDLCVAKNQDCFPNLERALMACKIRYDFIAPHGTSFWMDFKESEFGTCLTDILQESIKRYTILKQQKRVFSSDISI